VKVSHEVLMNARVIIFTKSVETILLKSIVKNPDFYTLLGNSSGDASE